MMHSDRRKSRISKSTNDSTRSQKQDPTKKPKSEMARQTADMLKARLIKTQQEAEAKKKQDELERNAQRKLQLERRKQRIIEQKKKMKEQQEKRIEEQKRKAESNSVSSKENINLKFSIDEMEIDNENEEEKSTAEKIHSAHQIAMQLEHDLIKKRGYLNGADIIPTAPSDPTILDAIHSLSEFVQKNGIDFENVVRERRKSDPKFQWLFNQNSMEFIYYKWKCNQIERRESVPTEIIQMDRGPLQGPSLLAGMEDSSRNLNESIGLVADSANVVEVGSGKVCQNSQLLNKSKWDAKPTSIDYDDLHEQEKHSHSSQQTNQSSLQTYNTAPPPTSLYPTTSQHINTSTARPHMFSVIGVHSNKRPNESSASIPVLRRRRRRFTEQPSGDLQKRNESDTVAQIDFYARNADQTEQRTEIPAIPEREEIVEEEVTHHIGDFAPSSVSNSFERKLASRLSSKAGPIGVENKGHQMLKRMGWKEGASLGATGSDGELYDAYKEKMKISYRLRPNPLKNPRTSYY